MWRKDRQADLITDRVRDEIVVRDALYLKTLTLLDCTYCTVGTFSMVTKHARNYLFQLKCTTPLCFILYCTATACLSRMKAVRAQEDSRRGRRRKNLNWSMVAGKTHFYSIL